MIKYEEIWNMLRREMREMSSKSSVLALLAIPVGTTESFGSALNSVTASSSAFQTGVNLPH